MTKREFLQTMGAVPSLRLMAGAPAVESAKFTSLDCSGLFSAAHGDLAGIFRRPVILAKEAVGRQAPRGIPFAFGPGDEAAKRYLLLSRRGGAALRARAEVPATGEGGFLCLAAFVDWDANEYPAPGEDIFQRVGQPLADLVMVFEDGSEHRHPIRRRFEVSSPSVQWGQQCFTGVAHRHDQPSKGTDALDNARQWGDLQTGVWDRGYTAPLVWLSAIEVPAKGKLKAVRLESTADDVLAVCGLSLYHGRENPLRYERLALYRITLPEAAGAERWDVSVDLGVVARCYQLARFEPEKWLEDKRYALGQQEAPDARFLYAEVTASREATLTLEDKQSHRQWTFDVASAEASSGRVEFLERRKSWVHVRLLDDVAGKPTPARITMRSADGRYIPPYGHRCEISSGWFQDYGADLKLHDTSYAFVDGAFQVELPVGEVYIEVTKGFEYQPIRRKLEIGPETKDLELRLTRFADLRSKGWVNADSHVHFLSPPTALLEAQAEGLNLINLLAAQWGDLFTNVGDLGHGSMTAPGGETMVKMGTENRNHLLGHLGLLGETPPVFPMSAAGPSESYLGDPLWLSLAEWADRCRERDGLVMAVHFPQPTAELAADIVLGKIDAVEIRPDAPTEHFNNQKFLEWYHYLNCGYRLPVFGGTDKMSASMAAGSLRGYAHLNGEEFTFANWAKAVRSGNTFMTSGPLLLFQADGRAPGAEIRLRSGGGSVEVQAEAQSTIPIHRLEVVWNGKVVSETVENAGAHRLILKDTVRVPGPGWLAARCASRVPNRERRIAAHTSPVYVVVPGEDLFSAPAAAYLLTLMEGSEAWTRQYATRADDDRMAKVLRVFEAARAKLHERMHRHGIPH